MGAGPGFTSNQATLTLAGQGASIAGIQGLSSNSGSLTLSDGAGLILGNAFSNDGNITLGAGSVLTVDGAYNQGSTATLDVQLGRALAGGQFGQLVVTGSAALAGTLQAELVDGYSPAGGDTFPVMSFASATGSFATIDSPLYDGAELFQVQTNPTTITFDAAQTIAELAVTTISASPSPVQPGQDLTVDYSVVNQGDATAVSSWVDSVFLSDSGELNSSTVLVGRVTHDGALAAGASYSGTLTADVPPVLPGNYYVVVEANSQGQVPDLNVTDEVLASSGTIAVNVPTLLLGPPAGQASPTSGTIADGQDLLYQVTIPADQDVQIVLNGGADSSAELLVGYDEVPTQAAALASAFVAGQARQAVTLSGTQGGTYYVLVLGQSGAAPARTSAWPPRSSASR